jgi:hypothetical protein
MDGQHSTVNQETKMRGIRGEKKIEKEKDEREERRESCL